jgi:O-antigen/teichoic acid export membrane protein
MPYHWVQSVGLLLSTAFFSRLAGAMLAYLLARGLGPSAYGQWITFMIFISYTPLLCLGAVETLVKEVPRCRARCDWQALRHIESGVIGLVCMASLTAITISAGIWALGLDLFISYRPLPNCALVFAIASISFFSGYSYHRLVAHERFGWIASADGVRALASLILIGSLSLSFGLIGALWGLLGTEMVVCIMTMRVGIVHLGPVYPRINWEQAKAIVRVGLPISCVWWMLVFQSSIDRLLLGILASTETVGFYGLGISIISALATLPMVAGRVLYPKMNREIWEGVEGKPDPKIVVEPSAAVLMVSVNLAMATLACLPIVYRTILPRYESGLAAGIVLVVGTFFYTLVRTGTSFLIAASREHKLLIYGLAAVMVNAIGGFVLFELCGGMIGVALASVTAAAVLGVLVWRYVLGFIGLSVRAIARDLLLICCPWIVLVCFLSGYVSFVDLRAASQWGWLIFMSITSLAVNLTGAVNPMYRQVLKTQIRRVSL